MKLYLTRHGQDEDNAAGVLNGHRDKPLTELGVTQAQALAAQLESLSFDFIISSPLVRCVETAKIVKGQNNNTPIKINDLLIERNMGVMTGTMIADIDKNYHGPVLQTDVVKYFLEPEGGETFPDMMTRSKSLLKSLSVESGDNVLLVTSGSVAKALIAQYYNWNFQRALNELHFGNCELIELSENGPLKVFEQEQFNYEDELLKG